MAFGPAGAADPVGIGLGGGGHIIVDHVRDPGHIQAAGGDIGGHQHGEGAVAETVQGGLALVLGHVALEIGGPMTGGVEAPGQLLGPVLGAGENQGRLHRVFGQQGQQQGRFLLDGDGIEGLADGGRRLVRGDPDFLGIAEDVSGQAADVGGHGGGKHHVLALSGQMLDNPANIGQKAHVEHLVGLVHDQDFHLVQAKGSGAEMIKQPAGAGHHDLGPLANFGQLHVLADPAVNGHGPQAGLPSQLPGGDGDLLGQLPGRGDNQGADPAPGPGHQALKDGQHKSRGLAGAGLGQAHDIPAGQGRDQGLLLNGGGCLKTAGGDAGRNRRRELE